MNTSYLSTFVLVALLLFTTTPDLKATTYADWQAQHFTSGDTLTGPNDNPALDGVPNLEKYAFGLDPKVSCASGLPVVFLAADGRLAMTFTQDSSLSDIFYVPEVSADLVTWTRGPGVLTLTRTVPGQGTQSLATYEANTPLNACHRLFLRVTILKGELLPDGWQLQYFGLTGLDPNSSPDGNGLTLFQDYLQGNDPTNYYSQNGAIITPTITITGGNNQTGPSATFVAQPLVVKVTDASNHPLAGAPVTFAITGTSGGGVATATGGSVTASLAVTTDSTGSAQVYYAGVLADGAASSIHVTAGTSSTNFNESTEPIDNSVAAATNVVGSPGAGNGESKVTWVNNASNATFFIILESIDGVYWTTVATVNDPTATSYTVTGLNPAQSYYFAVIAGNPN